jgi:membrane protease YdiL (CAAX protease family)
MQQSPAGNEDFGGSDVFESLNQYFLLFFALCCLMSSIFIQEFFITIEQFRLGIAVAPLAGIVLPVFLLTRRFRGSIRRQLRFGGLRAVRTSQIIAATLCMVVVVDHVYLVSQQFMPVSDHYLEGLKALKPTGPGAAILTFIGLCVVVPVAEEIVFRGLIQRIFDRNMGGVLAMCLAGVLFGAVHFNPELLLSMVCFGLFLGFIFYATSNLTYTILAHATLNGVAFVQLTFEPVGEMHPAPFYLRSWWYLPVAAALALLLMREIKRGVDPTPQETPKQSEQD